MRITSEALPLGLLPFQLAQLAACAGRAGNADTAREVVAQGLFPEGVRERVVDLGTGYGEFAIDLARRYPKCSVWAVDREDVSGLSGRCNLPPNLINCGETGFDGFVTAMRTENAELGAPLVFDLAYILFPNPSLVGAFLSAALGVVSDQGVIQILTESSSTAEFAATTLTRKGFLVREVSLPPQVGSVSSYGRALASSDEVHWVVARRYQPEEFVIPPVGGHPPPDWPNFLKINGGIFSEQQRHSAEVQLSRLFGRAIDVNLFLHAVGVGVPAISLDQLIVRRTEANSILIDGGFTDDSDDRCGSFQRSIPPPPAPGEPWIAEGHGFDSYFEYRRQIVDRMERGIARSWHQRFLPFLAWLGVDQLQFNATQSGSYAWARLGFDFRDDGVRTEMIEAFRVWLATNDCPPSLDDRAASLRHAWEVAYFTDEAGRELGKEFLLWWGQHHPGRWAARFSLHPSYPGWRLLFKDQAGKAS